MELSRGKTAILIVMLAGSCYYGYSKYKSITPGPAINNGHGDEFARGSRDRTPEGDKRREEFMASMNLTPEQKEAMAALRKSGEQGEGRDRFTSFSQILTPAQRAQMQAARDARRDKGAKAALNSGDFAKYKEKEAARRASWGGGRGGPGGPGGPRGPRP